MLAADPLVWFASAHEPIHASPIQQLRYEPENRYGKFSCG